MSAFVPAKGSSRSESAQTISVRMSWSSARNSSRPAVNAAGARSFSHASTSSPEPSYSRTAAAARCPVPHAGSRRVSTSVAGPRRTAKAVRAINAASCGGVVLSCRTWVSSHRRSRNSKVSRGPSLRPTFAASATRSRARAESSGGVVRDLGKRIRRPAAAMASPDSVRLPSASNRGHSSSRPPTSLCLPLSRSHCSTSASENCGLTSVPPMRAGKESCRRRQLLTAARPTPAIRAISARLTGTASWALMVQAPRSWAAGPVGVPSGRSCGKATTPID